MKSYKSDRMQGTYEALEGEWQREHREGIENKKVGPKVGPLEFIVMGVVGLSIVIGGFYFIPKGIEYLSDNAEKIMNYFYR